MGGSTSGNGGDHSQEDLGKTSKEDQWNVLSPPILIHKQIPKDYWGLVQSTIPELVKSLEFPVSKVEITPVWKVISPTIKLLDAVCVMYFSLHGIFSRIYGITKDPIGISIDSTMSEDEIACRANAIVAPYNLKAEILSGIQSVGVGGDERTVTAVINLIGPNPGNHVLANLSSKISNNLPVNRVTYELSRKVDQECTYGPADKS